MGGAETGVVGSDTIGARLVNEAETAELKGSVIGKGGGFEFILLLPLPVWNEHHTDGGKTKSS